MVFTGTYKRSLDGKLRVLLPKRLRLGLPEASDLFLTPGVDHCLELHTRQSLNELALRAEKSAAGSKKVRSFSRLFYARAEQCDVDKQGRIRIPSTLAQLADLEREVVFIGVGFHWELWNLKLWDSYLQRNSDAFDGIAETTFDPPSNPAAAINQPGRVSSVSVPPGSVRDDSVHFDSETDFEPSKPKTTPK